MPAQDLKSEWPESVHALAGAWSDFPTAEELRQSYGQDIAREPWQMFEVPASFFEPLPDDLLDAFEGILDARQ